MVIREAPDPDPARYLVKFLDTASARFSDPARIRIWPDPVSGSGA